jgi:uroporphyrinogen-III decarboxylase
MMMTSSERLYTAMSGGIPDRVPVVPKIWVDLAANLTGTDLVEVVTDPMTALQVIVDAGFICDVDAVRQFHLPQRKILRKNGKIFETTRAGATILGEIDIQGGLQTHLERAQDFRLGDAYTMAFYHFWTADEPFVKNVPDAEQIAIPEKKFYEEIGWGKRQRTIIENVGNTLALIGDCSSATMAFYVGMRGMQRAMLDLIEQPQFVHRVMEKGVAIAVEKGKFNIDLGIRVLRLNDSVGNMSVISPRHWRTFIFPHMKAVCDELHRYNQDVRIYCHICGNVLPIVEDLVETGLDCIGPLDPLGGFLPADVRQEVGDAVSLMGGVNTLTFLQGSPSDILHESRACIQQAGEHGGYILGSGCVVPRDAKKENLLALREAAERYGKYQKREK